MCYEWFERKSSVLEKLKRGKEEALRLATIAARKAEVAKTKPVPQAAPSRKVEKEPEPV
jgi:hypothetical protein